VDDCQQVNPGNINKTGREVFLTKTMIVGHCMLTHPNEYRTHIKPGDLLELSLEEERGGTGRLIHIMTTDGVSAGILVLSSVDEIIAHLVLAGKQIYGKAPDDWNKVDVPFIDIYMLDSTTNGIKEV